jgi:hypothetical protein
MEKDDELASKACQRQACAIQTCIVQYNSKPDPVQFCRPMFEKYEECVAKLKEQRCADKKLRNDVFVEKTRDR